MSKVIKQNEITLATNVVKEKDLRKAQKRALEFFSDAVQNTYGPMGAYTAYSYGDPNSPTKAVNSNYTKDGFTVLKHLSVDKPIEMLLQNEIRDICTNVIKVIGDGTTSAVMLSNFIFQGLLKLQEMNIPKRAIIQQFKEVIKYGITLIESNKKETDIDDIYNIALTSLNGQEEYAKQIQKIYASYGMNVFIDVGVSNTPNTVIKTYSGMTYEAGYISPCFTNNKAKNNCELPNPDIFVFESPIDTPEMIGLLRLIIHTNIEEPARAFKDAYDKGKKINIRPIPTLIICPHISRDADSYIDQLIDMFSAVPVDNRLPLCVVSGINNNNQYLLDIMNLTGAKFIKKYIDPDQYEEDKKAGLAPTVKNIRSFAGNAEQVVVDALSTRIINPARMYGEDREYTDYFNNYIDQLKDLLHKYEETREELLKIGKLKRRINILQGNMVDLYVGGIGISDRDSLRDSIEDAVLNCRSAAKEGVCNGANYEGLRVFNKVLNDTEKLIGEMKEEIEKIEKEEDKKDLQDHLIQLLARKAVLKIVTDAYLKLAIQLYLPYCDDNSEKAGALVAESVEQQCPLNMITSKFDHTVLTSIKTEPAMLEAIAKIITLLFNTNQFLLPDARYNIYEMTANSYTIEENK